MSGGRDAERAFSLTRQFGVHGLLTLGDDVWLRGTVEEHSFRRETYLATRVAWVRRLRPGPADPIFRSLTSA